MSSNDELSSDEERDFEGDVDFNSDESESSENEEALSAEDNRRFNNELSSNEEDVQVTVYISYESESWQEEETLSSEDGRLFAAVASDDAAAVQQALRDGANANAACIRTTPSIDHNDTDAAATPQHAFRGGRANVNVNVDVRIFATPLMVACRHGYDQIVGILLDAGADTRPNSNGFSPIFEACHNEHLSTAQVLINHDNGLLEMEKDSSVQALLFFAVSRQNSELGRFLLDCGADPHCVDPSGATALMHACDFGRRDNVRLLMATGADVEARNARQQTALHRAACRGDIEVVRELILQHNANMFAVDASGRTPFDMACVQWRSNAAVNSLLEMHGNKLTHDHGRLALHELLKVAEYLFAEDKEFHPPLNPLRIMLPLGKLTLKHLRTLLHTLDPELMRNRDDTGKLPLHIACQMNAPVEVLALILEIDSAVLHIADFTGALPIHLLCGTATAAATEYASVRYLVEQGGVGTLAVRDRQGLLPLHVLCGSTNPPLRAVQYLIQSCPVSLAMRTNAGEYPFMMAAAADSSSASLSVIYEVVRANPGLVVPR